MLTAKYGRYRSALLIYLPDISRNFLQVIYYNRYYQTDETLVVSEVRKGKSVLIMYWNTVDMRWNFDKPSFVGCKCHLQSTNCELSIIPTYYCFYTIIHLLKQLRQIFVDTILFSDSSPCARSIYSSLCYIRNSRYQNRVG